MNLKPRLPLLAVVTAALLIQLILDVSASACSYNAEWVEFDGVGDSERPDAPLPAAVEVSVVKIERGTGPTGGCGGQSSCDDIGFITFEFSRATGEGEGFLIETRGKQVPEALSLPDVPVRVEATHTVGWSDGAAQRQEAIDFEIRVTAVDAWGESGPPSDWARARDAGSFP